MKTLLLALTGMGNSVLEFLLTVSAPENILVLTRAETGPYPYYSCPDLSLECDRLGVRHLTGVDPGDPDIMRTIARFGPDLGLAATYHRIVSPELIAMPTAGFFNIHPSLLPAYRGPMPTNWAIIHGEKTTGVTVHEMTPELDAGRIVLSESLDIGLDCDGELRRRAGLAAGRLAFALLEGAARGTLTPRPQEGLASYHPRLTSPKGLMLLRKGGFLQVNLRRGLTPWPGMGILAPHCPS